MHLEVNDIRVNVIERLQGQDEHVQLVQAILKNWP